MAVSRKPLRNKPLSERVADVLDRHLKPGARLALGLSGGVDSVVLFHFLVQLKSCAGFDLFCVHVHHGLSDQADTWAHFCEHLCQTRGIACEVHRVQIDRADPAGIEAAARRERQRIFSRLDVDCVLTAHHQDDQAETLLLQLLRGAGPKGLAAMAESTRPPGWKATLLRPLLEVSRADILHHAETRRIEWVEDESNLDPAYNRNFLRHRILPLLIGRFPAAIATLGRAASLQAEAACLLDDLAGIDAAMAVIGERLDCAALAHLSPPRARNLLRGFIGRAGLSMPSERRLAEALHQLLDAGSDARVRVRIDDAIDLRRYRGGAYLVPIRHCASQPDIRWLGEAAVCLCEADVRVRFDPRHGQGLSRARIETGRVELGVRRGGERIRLARGGPHRSLKNLLQESSIPPWRRACLPILRLDGTVVWVGGIGMDADFLAGPDESGIVLNWDENRGENGRGD